MHALAVAKIVIPRVVAESRQLEQLCFMDAAMQPALRDSRRAQHDARDEGAK